MDKRTKLYISIGLAVLITVLLGRLVFSYSVRPEDKLPGGNSNSFYVLSHFSGSGTNRLLRPLAAAMDNQGDIYVVDSSHHRVVVFDLHGKVIKVIGKPGTGKGEFDYPTALAIQNYLLYVGDSSNFRIQVFGKQGEFLYVFPRLEDKLGKVKPLGLAIDRKGNVYVADGAGHRILVFDEKGKFLRSFGKRGIGAGEFVFPNGIALDEDAQNLYVADFANSRIQVFNLEGKLKKIISGEEVGLNNPRGLAYDPVNKRLFVTDIFEHRIVMLSAQGGFLSSYGSIGSGPQQFHFPNGLWYGKGILLVADRENHRIALIRAGGEKR